MIEEGPRVGDTTLFDLLGDEANKAKSFFQSGDRPKSGAPRGGASRAQRRNGR